MLCFVLYISEIIIISPLRGSELPILGFCIPKTKLVPHVFDWNLYLVYQYLPFNIFFGIVLDSTLNSFFKNSFYSNYLIFYFIIIFV